MTSGEDTSATVVFRTAMPFRYRAILGTLGFTAIAGTAVAALEAGPEALFAGLFIAVLFGPILLMTARISVTGSGVGIRVAAVFATEIRYREITGISAGPVTGLREGMGLRILPDGSGYLVGGPSVRIECGRTAVLVSCSDPDGLLDAIAPQLDTTPVR